MIHQSMQKLRLDRRLIERSNWISAQELASERDALPDVAHKGMTLGEAEDAVRGSGEQSARAAGDPPPTS